MQGKKEYQEKLFTSFQLSERVPKENFYRRLKETLDLSFLYKRTSKYYGKSGQKSIDPVVFFKLCLVGYLENIISDRKIIEHSSMRLDILYFIDYDVEEELPWHSTISRTRQLFPEGVFEEVFTKVLSLCVNKGMVSGHTQVIDSAPVKANASMDSLELKVPKEELEEYLRKVRYMSSKERKTKINKASKEEQTITANTQQLKGIVSRNKKWAKEQDQRQGAGNQHAKYTSNKTHYSPTDPDARISVKPGKARKLNYLSQLSVDTAHHVITDIAADFAHKKDNQCLQAITYRLKDRLKGQGLLWHNLLADTGYSSGENYAFLEKEGLISYIPPHGTYKGGPEGFTYEKEKDCFVCSQGETIPFVKVYYEKKSNTKKKEYRASKQVCKGCTIREKCLKSSQEKRITITYYREEYERAIARLKGKQMMSKRKSTVEPVFGTLTQFMGMRKVFTKGIKQANKVMLMSAVAYNIKKYLKFTQKLAQSNRQAAEVILFLFKRQIQVNFMRIETSEFSINY
jgi:transposase